MKTKSDNLLNLTDNNIFNENIFANLLNSVYGYELRNTNVGRGSSDIIDLIDHTNKISFQVTSNTSTAKVNKTIKAFNSSELFKQGYSLMFLIVSIGKSYKDDEDGNIITVDTLLRDIMNTPNTNDLKRIESVINNEIRLSNDPIGSLVLRCEDMGRNELTDTLVFKYRQPDDEAFEGTAKSIVSNIVKVMKIELPENLPEQTRRSIWSQSHNAIYAATSKASKPVEFSVEEKEIIEGFADARGVEGFDSDNFFFVGDAKYNNSFIGLAGGGLFGNPKAQEKVRLINKIYYAITKLYGMMHFMEQFDDKHYISLVLENNGDIPCRDITLTLSVDTDAFCDLRGLTIIELQAAEELKDCVTGLLERKETPDIEGMQFAFVRRPIYWSMPSLPLQERSKPSLSYFQECLEADIESLYPCRVITDGNKTVLKFEIKGIKQATKTYICGILMFTKEVECMDYRIVSGHPSLTINGVLKNDKFT